MAIKNQAQLITYPDSLGGDLQTLNELLLTRFTGLFGGGVHILPPFPSSGDRGFAPITYTEIDPTFGTWADIERISGTHDVALDLMVNHISRRSPYFQDFLQHGRASAYADMFITLDKVWPSGNPPASDVAKVFLRKPDNPFFTFTIADTGAQETLWTSFGRRDWVEQIDLDVNSPLTRQLLIDYLRFFRNHGVKIVRLDAIGYVIKRPGTSCFMVEPEIYEFIDWMVETANGFGLELLPEVHDIYTVRLRLAEHGYWIYDFVLPLLTLHTLLAQTSAKLRDYLRICPKRQFTTLDTHDGIPVQPDVVGILTTDEARRVVEHCEARGANLNRILGEHKGPGGFDAHQINITYYDALNRNDDAYLAARAIQYFAPGVPQVYYVGALAGENDQAAVAATGEGRAINRHNYTVAEVDAALQRPVVQRLADLTRFRNTHPAFNGDFAAPASTDSEVLLEWRAIDALARLRIDLASGRSLITYTAENGEMVDYRV
jgi:sucrose phosphorylase